jgi:hypothetical protein
MNASQLKDMLAKVAGQLDVDVTELLHNANTVCCFRTVVRRRGKVMVYRVPLAWAMWK